MLRLAHAASSEYFSKYGTPPNQRRTGVTSSNPGGNMDGEINISNFFGGWTAIFRPVDKDLAESIAWIMERLVMNGKYGGYGQGSLASDGGKYPRTGFFDAMKKLNGKKDPMNIKTLFNCDCSSSLGTAVYFSGVEDDRLRDMWTGSEEEILMSTGAFTKITDPLALSIGTGVRRGDILFMPGHTAVMIDSDDHYVSVPYRITNCYKCNLRSGPGMNYPVLKILEGNWGTGHKGEIVLLLDISSDGDWAEIITTEEVRGFVYHQYCKEQLDHTKAAGDTWLRKTPGTTGKGIIVIPEGDVVYLTGEHKIASSNGLPRKWYECVYANHLGWASSLYVKPM